MFNKNKKLIFVLLFLFLIGGVILANLINSGFLGVKLPDLPLTYSVTGDLNSHLARSNVVESDWEKNFLNKMGSMLGITPVHQNLTRETKEVLANKTTVSYIESPQPINNSVSNSNDSVSSYSNDNIGNSNALGIGLVFVVGIIILRALFKR